jgi:hypothetical protein
VKAFTPEQRMASSTPPTPSKRIQFTDQGGKTLLASDRVQALLDALILGESMMDAARAAGIRVKRARRYLYDPIIRKEYLKRLAEVTNAEKARNLALLLSIRDKGMDPNAKPAQQKVALEAVRMIEGEGEGSNIHIHGGSVQINGGSGYVIDLSGEKAAPKAISSRMGSDDKSLIFNDAVTIEHE